MDLNGILFPSPNNNFQVEDFEEELIFIPKIKADDSSEQYEEVVIGYIPCLLLLSKSRNQISKNFMIYFHGNAEDIFYAREIADKIRMNLYSNVLIVEYPGYSIYKEDKGSDKILQDSIYVFDYITAKLNIDPNYLYVFGRSLGSAPSCYLSSKRSFAGLVLMSPFTSIQAVAENLVGGLIKFLIAER